MPSSLAAARWPAFRWTADRRRALTSAWRAFWVSRLLVWSAGIIGVLVSDAGAWRELNPGAAEPSDTLSGLLVTPAYRWDAAFYVGIALEGYNGVVEHTSVAAVVFFPLYPLLIRVVGEPIDALGLAGAYSFELAGVLVSLAAFMVALYLVHRLTDLELGPRAADNAVALLALFPISFFFSAIYTESLFLAFAVGCVYSARRGWWWRAGVLGALASATRPQGLLLLLPLAIMLWHGPRTEGKPVPAPQNNSVRVRYRPRPRNAAALLLVPLGLIAFMAYVRETTRYGALAPFKAQELWGREFKGPIIGLWDGIKDGADAVRGLMTGGPMSGPYSAVRQGLVNIAALAFAGIGVAGALRRLPIAYGAYALGGLIFAISYPMRDDPLRSLPRFVIVLFPIFMWAGSAMTRWGPRNLILAVSAAGLACFSAAFASGFWIA
jgi:Mannosyltransferase (PIG-V)